MELNVLIPFVFAVLFLIVIIRMIFLIKKSQNDIVENLGNKLNPYLYTIGILSVLMAICMIFVTVLK